jgi:hypothetical protein
MKACLLLLFAVRHSLRRKPDSPRSFHSNPREWLESHRNWWTHFVICRKGDPSAISEKMYFPFISLPQIGAANRKDNGDRRDYKICVSSKTHRKRIEEV